MPAQIAEVGARLSLVLAFVLVLGACAEDSNHSTKTAGDGDASRGKQIYLAYCTACHNSDPAKNGPIGPAIKGSSRALLEVRVLRAGYPPGYTPKRATSLMPAQPDLAPKIPDLAAFLR